MNPTRVKAPLTIDNALRAIGVDPETLPASCRTAQAAGGYMSERLTVHYLHSHGSPSTAGAQAELYAELFDLGRIGEGVSVYFNRKTPLMSGVRVVQIERRQS